MEYIIAHSAKGTTWKNKKYIRKEKTKSGKTRYIYPEKGGVSSLMNRPKYGGTHTQKDAVTVGARALGLDVDTYATIAKNNIQKVLDEVIKKKKIQEMMNTMTLNNKDVINEVSNSLKLVNEALRKVYKAKMPK